MQEILELQRKVVPELVEVLEKRYNVLRTIYYNQPIGRRMLANELNLGERVVRNEIDLLKSQSLIEINTPGMTVTKDGQKVLDGLKEFIYEIKGLNDIEQCIKSFLGVKDVVIVPGNVYENPETIKELGRAAANYIKNLIKDKDINFIKSLFNYIERKQISVEKELASNDIRENIFNLSKKLAKNVTEKSEGAKEVIRNIISSLKESNGNSTQILNIMKSSINDLKLFNKINDQYYCLDIPVNFKENEYPCKLIIKDDRKNGKVIDSTNFKVAVSVKTVKLGTVDALLDVKNRNIDIQLKCDKNVMNLFVISKDKLKDIVESSGFSTKIEVVERTEKLQLLSCREFFNDNNIAVVDITV